MAIKRILSVMMVCAMLMGICGCASFEVFFA